ncbi:MAG: ribonuclease P protein component 4 [Candidatus Thorarchaeota archaeon]
MSRRRHPRAKARRLTQARVDILWEQAKREIESGRPELARQRMLSARRIAQRTRTKIPRHISRRICKTCGTILVPGDTCRVRVRHNRSKHVVVTCLSCGAIKRYYIQR